MGVTRAGLLAIGLVLSASCADSCSCGPGGENATVAKAPKPQPAPEARNAATPAESSRPPAHGAGAEQRPGWSPAPDSALIQKLAKAKAALETDTVYPKLADERTLAKLLKDKLGSGYTADAPAAAAPPHDADAAKLMVVARSYHAGDKALRLKLTDTAQLPAARRVVSGRLTLIGNAAVGNERGVLLRGDVPAVTAYYPAQRVSRASAIVARRYLVQLMVTGTEDADEALHVLTDLDLARLR